MSQNYSPHIRRKEHHSQYTALLAKFPARNPSTQHPHPARRAHRMRCARLNETSSKNVSGSRVNSRASNETATTIVLSVAVGTDTKTSRRSPAITMTYVRM